MRTMYPLSLIALFACNPGGKDYADADFREVLAVGGEFEEPENRYDEEVVGSTETTGEDGEPWVCLDKAVSYEQAPLEYATFDPNSDVIYPGSLLQGATLAEPTPEPIAVERAGGTVTIDLVNGSQGVSVDVDEVSYGSIQTAMNEIIAENTGIGAARFTFEASEVQSEQQLAASIGVNVSTLTTDFAADLAFSTDQSYNRQVVRLVQSYYTMTWSLPTSLADVFAPGVTPEDVARYVEPGNPAAYVASVTYGRIFYLLIETTSSRTELQASVDASYRAAVVGGDLSADVTYVTDLENVRIKVFALGGDPSLALATFSGDYEAVRDFLVGGGDIATGRPLSYKLRSVTDNETVYVKVAGEYEITECLPVDLDLPSPIARYDADQFVETASEGLIVNGVTAWGDAWADPDMVALPFNLPFAGSLYDGEVNNRADAVHFTLISGYSENSLLFPGAGLRNTDWTIFALVQNRTNPDDDATVRFLWGTNPEPRQGLVLSFLDNRTVAIDDGARTLTAGLDVDSQSAWHLLTFRFSQTDGMRIYVNGELRAEDAAWTEPLIGFAGAQMGAADVDFHGSPFVAAQIGDLKLVGEALDDKTRGDAEEVMLVHYGL